VCLCVKKWQINVVVVVVLLQTLIISIKSEADETSICYQRMTLCHLVTLTFWCWTQVIHSALCDQKLRYFGASYNYPFLNYDGLNPTAIGNIHKLQPLCI